MNYVIIISANCVLFVSDLFDVSFTPPLSHNIEHY